jgi:acylphosphatase
VDVRRRLVVRGQAQGVGFRASVRERADGCGVRGWVANHRDGSVEVVLEGGAETVAEIVDFCRIGPSSANVGDVDEYEEAPEGLTGFGIR